MAVCNAFPTNYRYESAMTKMVNFEISAYRPLSRDIQHNVDIMGGKLNRFENVMY